MNLGTLIRKKRFGQHFLTDKNISQKIAGTLRYIHIKYNVLMEIGPGNGSLTDFLVKKNDTELFLVEIDRDLIDQLKKKYRLDDDHIIQGDFLKLDLGKLVSFRQTGITGNFPYNISSQIVVKVIENRHLIPEMTGMFQKEMAERITSQPGSKSYGRLSALTQAFYDTEYIFSVGRQVFSPPPKVESGVIRLTRKEVQPEKLDFLLFSKIIKTAFNQRRKKIRNSLSEFSSFFSEMDQGMLLKRAEELSAEDYISLARLISGQAKE